METINPLHIVIAVSIATALILLALWLRDRNRLLKRVAAIAAQQRELEGTLNGFMEEFEKIALQFSRLVAGPQTPADAGQELVADAEDLFQYKTDQEERAAAAGHGIEKRHLVLALAQKGRSATQIADRLMIPRGEVTLILNLNQERGPATALEYANQQ